MNHYSNALNPQMLSEWANRAAAFLVDQWSQHNRGRELPVLCYRGMSGIASATALSVALATNHPRFSFGMLYLRKSGEQSHGNCCHYNTIGEGSNADYTRKQWHFVFVDDFICDGGTLEATFRGAKDVEANIIWQPKSPMLLSSRELQLVSDHYTAEKICQRLSKPTVVEDNIAF